MIQWRMSRVGHEAHMGGETRNVHRIWRVNLKEGVYLGKPTCRQEVKSRCTVGDRRLD